ncbi:unnamed protein product [Dovyalis caffra]|uniref:Uncharacterized protein n=1 Tax=Dovyalis caffra TaxID=77055 RepID=A0AAV1QVL3_9ROSI|nr:unnamed protein product [Dovyalis caffra]
MVENHIKRGELQREREGDGKIKEGSVLYALYAFRILPFTFNYPKGQMLARKPGQLYSMFCQDA